MTGVGSSTRDSRNADFLQVTFSEGQEDTKIHILFLKHVQVLQTPNLLQQCGKVLKGRDNWEAWGQKWRADLLPSDPKPD